MCHHRTQKYACVEEGGSYDWHCNGLPAPSNTHVDVLKRFESVLSGSTEYCEYFSIQAGKDLILRHTTGAKKALRFLCLKGRSNQWRHVWAPHPKLKNTRRLVVKPMQPERMRLRFWEDQAQFEEYAENLRPLGFDVSTVVPPQPIAPIRELVFRTETRGRKIRPNPANIEQEAFVYALRRTDEDVGDSYVGSTPTPAKRLRQHNGEIAGGAPSTAGRQWTTVATWSGFRDRKEALKFESAMHRHTAMHYSEWAAVAQTLIERRFPHVREV